MTCDNFKFIVWRKKIKKIINKSELIFVSNWIYHRFLYYVHINPKIIENHVHIINNSVGEIFENKNDNNSNEENLMNLQGKKVLIVDDNLVNIKLASRLTKFRIEVKSMTQVQEEGNR